MSGRFVVAVVVAVGVALAAVAFVMRSGRGPSLPLQPGIVVLFTAEDGGVDLGPLAADAVEFVRSHGVSSDRVASLGSILTGRMPRESGLVREGETLAREVALLVERLLPMGFQGGTFLESDRALLESGVGRGAKVSLELPTTASEGGSGRASSFHPTPVEQAAGWIASRARRPTLCHVHVQREGARRSAELFARLHESGLSDRLVAVAIALDDPRAPRLLLRAPPGLLPDRRVERDVSLLDVAPTVLELFGIPVPPGLMEPFLLGPRVQAPRFFLFTEPLEPPRADCDAVTLRVDRLEYSLSSVGEETCDPSVRGELRRILESAFGYRVEPAGDGAVRARFVGRLSPREPR